jgi:hypothetical protein
MGLPRKSSIFSMMHLPTKCPISLIDYSFYLIPLAVLHFLASRGEHREITANLKCQTCNRMH